MRILFFTICILVSTYVCTMCICLCGGFVGMGAFLLGTSFLDCRESGLSVALVSLCLCCLSFTTSGFFTSMLLITPSCLGSASGFTCFVGSIAAMAIPFVIGAITQNVGFVLFFYKLKLAKTTSCLQTI